MTVVPFNPRVRQALSVLDSADDTLVSVLGCWRGPDGALGREVTRREWREGLLSGEVDPDALIRTIDLLRPPQAG